MPRGNWDYGVNPAGQITSPEIGLAELAARLGSLSRFDRQGEVVFQDGFEAGLGRWYQDLGSPAGTIVLTTVGPGLGGYTVILTPGAAVAAEAALYGNMPVPSEGTLGLEVLCVITSLNTDIELRMNHNGAGGQLVSGLRYSGQSDRLEYRDSTAAWVAVPGAARLSIGDGIPHLLKFVIDIPSYSYVRAVADGQRISLAGLAVNRNAAPALRANYLDLVARSWGGAANAVYLDNVVLTHNEP